MKTLGVAKLEKEIQADIVQLLEAVGARVYKIGTTRKKGDHQGTMQTPGIPDLCAFVPVTFALSLKGIAAPEPYRSTSWVQLWIEVKRPGETLSEAQDTFRANALKAGEEHVTGGVDEVLDWLKARGVVK